MRYPAESKYDIVIIGSGMGGLFCARLLGMHGYKVCVLEKNRQLGGNLQTFARDKCIFDTGVHYIGGLDKGQNLYQCFKYAGLMEHLHLKKMDEEAFDVILFDGDENEYPHGMGYENFQKNLIRLFPEEKENIQAYCQAIKDICKLFPIYNLSPNTKDNVINKYFEISAKDFIATFTDDQKLRNVLGGTNLLYAGYAERSPAYMHALVINTYIESSWRCVNGGSQISKGLVKLIKQSGGEVLKYADVTEFLFEEERLAAVQLRTGEKFYADNFISNIHPQVTLDLIGRGRMRRSYESRIHSLQNTTSLFSLYLVLKPNTFKYINSNYYWYKDDVWSSIDYDKANWPESYMLLTSATTKSEEYADSITIMTYMDFEEVEQWKDTFNTVTYDDDRGEDYQEFKRRKSERILDIVEQRFPGLRDKVKTYYSSTPLSYRDYINTPDGSAYGVLRDCNNPLRSYLSPRTKLKNLYLTGQNLNMHGILGVTVGAIITSSQFLDAEQLINDIRHA